MESNKNIRRRAHEHDYDPAVQMKRKRKRDIEQDKSDSVQILGETQLRLESNEEESQRHLVPNGGCALSGIPLNQMSNSRYPLPGNARAKDKLTNGSLRDAPNSLSALPPNPCESDRMLFVQQWINSIRSDIPLWVQTSLTRIVPISGSDCYPTEADSICPDRSSREDCSRLSPGTSLDVATGGYSSNQLRSAFGYPNKTTVVNASPLSALCSRYPGAQQPNSTDLRRPNALQSGQPYPSTRGNEPSSGLPATVPVQQTCNNSAGRIGYSANSLGRMMSCELDTRGAAQMAPAGRLFDDTETQLVVKLFRDYFTKGSCPILSEVRRRTANTVFEGRRTATSIRAKIKRLQTSGRWTDYAGI